MLNYIEKLAIITPGASVNWVVSSPLKDPNLRGANVAGLVSLFLNVFFYIAGFLLLFWLIWGVFQYLLAGGNKEGLSAAKKRIRLALIGFIIVTLSFALAQYAQTLFTKAPGYNNFNTLTPITIPAPIP